ncbi:P-loop containing nucleoside triphosphate hydrolase protein, partial [Gorgonomyces haynaldii]
MDQLELDHVFKDKQMLKRLKDAKIDTLANLLTFDPQNLSKHSKMDLETCQTLIQTVSSLFCPNVAEFTQPKYLTTGCPRIDNFFGGGLPTRMITEVYGQSSTGKTSFSLQLLMQSQLSLGLGGLEGSSLYVSTKSRYCVTRMEQLLEHFLQQHPHMEKDRVLENIHVWEVRDMETQQHILKYQLRHIVEACNIKFIAIDSIAGNFRAVEDEDAPTRSRKLAETYQYLHELAVSLDLAVLVINEATAAMQNYTVADPNIAKNRRFTFPSKPPSFRHADNAALGMVQKGQTHAFGILSL